MPPLHYRLRVRNQANSADVLSVATVGTPGITDEFPTDSAVSLGPGWTTHTAPTALLGVTGGEVYLVSPPAAAYATRDLGLADVRVAARMTVLPTGVGTFQGIIARYSKPGVNNNYWAFLTNGVQVYVQKFGDEAATPHTSSPAGLVAGVELAIETEGDTLRFYVGGTLITTIVDDYQETATRHGVRIDIDATRRIDHFSTGALSAAHPYLLTAPTGDGESFDPLTGETIVGSYTVGIIDAPHPTSSRIVTRELADAEKRWQLLGNVAIIEVSEVDPPVYTTLLTGFLTRLDMIDALAFEAEVGETRYLEERYQVFKTASTQFPYASNLIGPPVRGGFGPLPALAPWKFKVESVFATWVGLTLEAKPPGWQSLTANQINLKARDYRVPTSKWRSTIGSHAWYPRLNARIETLAGVLVGHFNPIAGPRINELGVEGDLFTIAPNPDIFLDWPSGGPVAQPVVGTEYLVYVFPIDISEENPLHIAGHPVDIHALAYGEAGIPYNAASLTALRSQLGADLWLDLRPTTPITVAELARRLQGLFGYATRIGAAGERVFFSTRIRNASAPVLTITKNDLREEGDPFTLDIKSAVSSVAVRQLTFFRFDPAIDTGEPALDGLVAVEQRSTATIADTSPLVQQEVLFKIDGQIMQRTFSLLPPIGEMVRVPLNLDQFVAGVGGEIGDRYGRGAWQATHHLLRGIDIQIGEELILDLDYQPNPETTPASRAGQRVVQVVHRTPTPDGLEIDVVDSGNAAQVATAPTFALANDAADAKRQVVATITNAAALAAAGSQVRIEWAAGGASTGLLTTVDPAVTTVIRLPVVDSGALVTVRMRAENPTRRPSAYASAFLDLADLAAPTGSTSSNRLITWTPTEASAMVELLYKRTTEAQYQRLALLTPGSTSYTASQVAGGVNYDVQIRHRDAPPLNGVSAAQTILLTPSGSAAPAAPTDPSIWSGRPSVEGVIVVDGTYGYDVVASVTPGTVEFEVAIETAVGSATPGAYAVAGVVAAVGGGRTRFEGFAPNDGRRRYVRAFSVTPDGVRSAASSTALSVLPWAAFTWPSRAGSRSGFKFSDGTFAMRASDGAGRESDLSLFFPSTAPPAVGTVATPALLSKPVTISCTEFLPESRVTEWFLNSGRYIRPLAFDVDVFLYAPLIIPAGVTLTSVGARLYREAVDANIIAEYWFARIADDGTDTLLVSVQAHAGSGWLTLANVVSELVTDKRYIFGARVRVNSGGGRALENARVAWFQYTYGMPDYAKTL